MNTFNALNDLKDYIKENVADQMKLKCPDDSNVNNYKLVHPTVCVGWLPPKGFLPPTLESSIPCVIVGMDTSVDDEKDAVINIKLSLATYSPGEYSLEGDQPFIPSFNGYTDLVNLFDKTKAELIKNKIILGKYTIDKEIRFGMYEEQPYPYWYGFMTFAIRGKSYPSSNIEKLL